MQQFLEGGGGLDRIVLRSHIATRKKEVAGVPNLWSDNRARTPDPLLCYPVCNHYITTAPTSFVILQNLCLPYRGWKFDTIL